jgi:hypothetical protein
VDDFIRQVQAYRLCQSERWQNVGEMAALHDSELAAIADRLVPARTVVCRQRPSDPWFDADYRQVKRLLRRLERAASSASKRDDAVAAATVHTAWMAQRCSYRALPYDK